MAIKPNASPDEVSSPFYKANEEFCSEFESYIARKNGKVKGNYNAWSYLIFGKISVPKNWDLMYKKSTFTSGNLLLSSEYQSLLVLAKWETERKGIHNTEFNIRRKTRVDLIKLLLNKSLSKLDLSDKYVIEIKDNKPQLISKLTELLKNLFISGEIYEIDYRNDKLKIELRTKKHHFDLFDKLTSEI
jgi:hypothetical protein